MLRFEWLLCCHCPVCIYFMFAILRLNKPHLQPSGNADKRRGWNNRGCGRGSHTCSRTLFVSCCTSGATIAQTLLEFGIKCFFAFPDRCQFDNCSFKSSSLPSSNFFHRPVKNALVPLKGRNLPSGSSTTCDSGTGWSAQRYSVKCQFFPARGRLKGNQLIVLHLFSAFLLQEVGFNAEMEEFLKDPCDARALVYFGTPWSLLACWRRRVKTALNKQ